METAKFGEAREIKKNFLLYQSYVWERMVVKHLIYVMSERCLATKPHKTSSIRLVVACGFSNPEGGNPELHTTGVPSFVLLAFSRYLIHYTILRLSIYCHNTKVVMRHTLDIS